MWPRYSLHFESSSVFRMDSGVIQRKVTRSQLAFIRKLICGYWDLRSSAFAKTSHQTPESGPSGNYPGKPWRTRCGWWWTYQFLGPYFCQRRWYSIQFSGVCVGCKATFYVGLAHMVVCNTWGASLRFMARKLWIALGIRHPEPVESTLNVWRCLELVGVLWV